MKHHIENATPNLGCANDEPSLREIMFQYYNTWFPREESESLTKRYFEKLDHIFYTKEYGQVDYPDFDVSG